MKSIILDSGPIITLSLNNLLWLLEKAKEKYSINFFITEPVRNEIVGHALETKKYKFEALQVLSLIKKGVITVIEDKEINEKTKALLELANTTYNAQEHYLTLVHLAEMSAVSAAILYQADAVMIDERTTRYLIEKPDKLRNVLMHKLHTKVDINKQSVNNLKTAAKSVKFIRSAEFVTVAFEKGLLDGFLPEDMSKPREFLLEALLWGLKLNGCAISNRDLEILMRYEFKKK